MVKTNTVFTPSDYKHSSTAFNLVRMKQVQYSLAEYETNSKELV